MPNTMQFPPWDVSLDDKNNVSSLHPTKFSEIEDLHMFLTKLSGLKALVPSSSPIQIIGAGIVAFLAAIVVISIGFTFFLRVRR